MAFSTFRGMMAAAGQSAVSAFQTIFPQVAAIMGVPGSNNQMNTGTVEVILPSSTTGFFTAYRNTSGSNLYGCMMNVNIGNVTSGTPLVFSSGNYSQPQLVGDAVSATGYLLGFQNTVGGNQAMQVVYLTSSGSTLTLATGPTTYFSTQVGSAYAVCVLDGTYSIIMGGTGSAQQFSLIDSTALTQYATYSTAISMQNATDMSCELVGLSSTLGAFVYIDSGGSNIKCVGIDRSGGALSIYTGSTASLATAGTSASFGISKLTASTFLLSYPKSTTGIAARVITVASGGVITVGTEYTFATGSSSQNITFQSAALSSTLVLLSYDIFNPVNGSWQYSVPLTIAGSVVTFGTSQYSTMTSIDNSTTTAQMVKVSATQAAVLYLQGLSGYGNGNVGYSAVVDYGNNNPVWATNFAGNTALSGNLTFNSTSNIPIQTTFLGSNEALVTWYGTSSNIGWTAVRLDTNGSNIAGSSSNSTQSTLASPAFTSGVCRVYNDTSAGTRTLSYYYDSSNNVQFGILRLANGNITTGSYTSSFTNTGTQNNLIINMAPDSSLYLQGSGTTSSGFYQLQASIIATSGTTVSSISTLTNVTHPTNAANKCNPIFATAITSTLALVVYTSDVAAGAFTGVYAGIIDITSGTPTLATSAQLTPNAGWGGHAKVGVTVGTDRGVLFYDDVTTANISAIGFSYTTSAITVSGSPVSIGLATTYGISASVNECIGISGSELMLIYNNGSYQFSVVTTPNINSVSLGSPYPTPAAIADYCAFSAVDNQNALIINGYTVSSGNHPNIGYLFRS